MSVPGHQVVNFHWLPGDINHPPINAVIGGKAEDGQPLYVIRRKKDKQLVPGKMKKGENAYIGYGGKEHAKKNKFEILVNNHPGASG